VAEDTRDRVTVIVLGQVEVGVAQPAGLDVDDGFPPDRRREVDVLDLELPVMRAEHGSLHDLFLLSSEMTSNPTSRLRAKMVMSAKRTGVIGCLLE
jgi:hypothetical protein